MPKKSRIPKINPDFAAFLPDATPEEDAILFESIKKKGILQKIVVRTETGEIVDGHRRFRVWEKIVALGQTNFELPIDPQSFPDDEDVYVFMVENQCGRRNLSEVQKAIYRGVEFHAKRKSHGSPERFKNAGISPTSDNRTLGAADTAKELAERDGVARSTVYQDAKFAAGFLTLPTEEKAAVLAGKSDKTKAEIIAAAPLHCDRCSRLGPNKNCPQCLKMGLRKKDKKPPKKAKVGSVKCEWPKYWKDLAKLVRDTDAIFAAYDQKHSDDHKRAISHAGDFTNHMRFVGKKLNKEN